MEIPSKKGVVTKPNLSVKIVKFRAGRKRFEVKVKNVFALKGACEMIRNFIQFTDEYKSGGLSRLEYAPYRKFLVA